MSDRERLTLNPTLKILAGRVAAIALAAVLATLEKNGLPHDVKGIFGLAGIALAAVVAKSPDLFAAAGIIRPLSPGQRSLYDKLCGSVVAGVTTLIRTPAAKRDQKAKDMAVQGLQSALADPTTRDYLRSQLWQPGQPVPAGAQPPAPALAPDLDLDPNRFAAGGPPRASAGPADAAIAATGGNQ